MINPTQRFTTPTIRLTIWTHEVDKVGDKMANGEQDAKKNPGVVEGVKGKNHASSRAFHVLYGCQLCPLQLKIMESNVM